MTILITGASGFIGSRLINAACAWFGVEKVVAISSKPVTVCKTVTYQGLDFTLSETEKGLLSSVEVLIHLGAFTPKNGTQANSIEDCNSNIIFTENLFKLPLGKLRRIIYVSTVDVYEPTELITEDTVTLPLSLYGWSKLYCEQMANAFSRNQQISYQILRIGHVYGPGEEKYLKFLPKAIKSVLSDDPVELWGDGSELRAFIYIDDVVTAILQSVDLPPDVGPINVVGGVSISVRSLLDELIEISGKQVTIKATESGAVKRDYVFNNAKLRNFLLPVETDLITGLRVEYAHMKEIT